MRTPRMGIALFSAGLAFAGSAATAQADTVGRAAPQGAGYTCGGGYELAGDRAVGSAGTLTEFRFRATSAEAAGPTGTLQVLRPLGGTDYRVVGQVDATNPDDGSLVAVPASIPVEVNDVLGMYTAPRGQYGFPCVHASGGTSSYDLTGGQPAVGDTISIRSSNPGYDLNLEATVEPTPPPAVPLLEGHGVSGIRTRFDFTVNGPETAPSGSATLTTADGGFIRSGAISCFRQVSSTKAIFGVVDTVSKAPATRYREFYVEDNAFGGNKDRLVELARSSATAPPVSCKSATPKPGSGRLIRSGDISLGGVPA